MSFYNDQPLPTTINSLPTELIITIVRLSSPKPSWDNALERLTHLRNLALVSQVFRGPAQEELFRHVVLVSPAAAQGFVAVLESREGARFANTPRSLRAGAMVGKVGSLKRWPNIKQDELKLVLVSKRCSRLESVWLRRVIDLDIAAVVSGTEIHQLFCHNCHFLPGDQAPEASALTRLGVVGGNGWRSSLQPKVLPTLTSLEIRSGADIWGLIVPGWMRPFLTSRGGQLTALSITVGSRDSDTIPPPPGLFSNLQILDIHVTLPSLDHFLSTLPPSIRHLRVHYPEEFGHTWLTAYGWAQKFIEDAFEPKSYPSLEKLEHLRFVSDRFGPSTMPPGLETLLQLRLRMLSPGVTLSFEEEKQDQISDMRRKPPYDCHFNPAFWAFVDDAEAADKGRLSEIEDGVAGLSIRQ
ncbi:hypothetical protein RQP46_010885 [Phenoliferia psychrophenolica]